MNGEEASAARAPARIALRASLSSRMNCQKETAMRQCGAVCAQNVSSTALLSSWLGTWCINPKHTVRSHVGTSSIKRCPREGALQDVYLSIADVRLGERLR